MTDAPPGLGDLFGHFRLIEKIGEGGMGIVYRARDERLQRDVAVKFLNAKTLANHSARQRFRREALILGRLNHPNVEAVYDFHSDQGLDYLVLEYVPGTSLDERIPTGALAEKEVISLGLQLVAGLKAAHAHGIIHGDLKPGNLRVTPENVLKILDFGLAQHLASPDAQTLTESVTLDAELLGGTPPYMAPEQLQRHEPDKRSDIYSAGVVLYELATGTRPFPQRGQLLHDAILHSLPSSPRLKKPEISPGVDALILKCLQKDPNQRYQSAGDLANDLERISSGLGLAGSRPRRRSLAIIGAVVLALIAAGIILWSRVAKEMRVHPIRSIAILPFLEASGGAGQDYFADGMTEELISQLTQVSGLRVISHTSVMQYKGAKISFSDIAHQLGVDGVIAGTVYRVGNRIRITVELIDADSANNLWSHSYERDFGDALALQAEVARSIVDELQVKLTTQEEGQLAPRSPPVADATYDAYLQGRYHLNKRTPAAMKIAVTKFQEAVSQDPSYARAYVGLADTYSMLGVYRGLPPETAYLAARTAAQRALELDPKLGEAHAAMAGIRHFYLEWPGAEEEFKAALELNPGYANAHHWYALHLASQGRFTEAQQQIDLAAALDPNAPIINSNVAWCLYLARRYDDAIAKAKELLVHNPGFLVAHEYLGQGYLEKGRFDDAISELSMAVQLGGEAPYYVAELANAYASAGRIEEAKALLRQLESEGHQENVSPVDLALVYVGLHDNYRAIELLQKAVKERSPAAVNLKVHPRYDPLRSDPRFAALLERLGRDSEAAGGEFGVKPSSGEKPAGLVPTPAK